MMQVVRRRAGRDGNWTVCASGMQFLDGSPMLLSMPLCDAWETLNYCFPWFRLSDVILAIASIAAALLH